MQQIANILRPDFGKMTYRGMGREINGNSKKKLSLEINIFKIQTPKKGYYYFKKDEPIRFLAEMRMFPKWERW